MLTITETSTRSIRHATQATRQEDMLARELGVSIPKTENISKSIGVINYKVLIIFFFAQLG